MYPIADDSTPPISLFGEHSSSAQHSSAHARGPMPQPSVPPQPFFRARVVDGIVRTDGDPSALVGHRIERAGGRQGGNWVEWRWNGSSLSVNNDAFGAYPVYFAATESSIAISPSIDRLLELGIPRTLDLDALAAFLGVGYYLGADTPFRAIRALPANATLTWRAGELKLEGARPRLDVAEMTRAHAIDGIVELVRAAVERRIPDDDAPFLMPLSGGRDSRHILLELLRAGRPPQLCVTTHHYPTDWGDDPPYAARLCAELGVPHRILEPGPLVAAEWRKNRLTSYCSDEHAWYLPVVDALTGTTPCSYDGLGGGMILERRFMTPRVRRLQDAGRWDELAASLGKKDDDGRARYVALLAPRLRSEITAERTAGRIRSELGHHLDADDPYLSFTLFERTMREITLTPNAMLSGVSAVYTPFMDPAFMAFAASIPGEHINRALHDEALAAAFPKVAHVPFAPTRRPQPARRFQARLNRDLFGLLLRRSDGSLIDRSALARRAAVGSIRGDGWFPWGRRLALTVYLIQLETLTAG